MPSPFPGIDPYLEPRWWGDFHDSFITYARDDVQPQLPARYRARITERLVVSAPRRSIYPDVAVTERSSVREAAAVVYGTPPPRPPEFDEPVLFPAADEDLFENYIEIQDRESDRLVTAIELLSPTNKTPGPGRESYLRKQDEVMRADANLVELDLLRGGERTVAPALQLEVSERFYSLVCVWRAAKTRHEVYFVQLAQRLPRVRIPLLPEDNDVGLDLQALFTRCYDAARYELDLDYGRNPEVQLSSGEANWLHEHLRSAGQRS